MNNSVNNISFKAQLVTNLSGRHNIMSKVASDFAQKTSRIQGELCVKRGETLINPKTLVFTTEESAYVISDYAELMGNKFKNAKDITDDAVGKISDIFVNIFKALKFENKFVRKNQELIQNINRIRRVIERNEAKLNLLKQGNDQQAIKLLSGIIESNKSKLAKLESQYFPQKEHFLKQADKIAQDAPELKAWRSGVNDLESYV